MPARLRRSSSPRSLLAIGVLAAFACRGNSTEQPTPPSIEGRFPHSVHKERPCVDCHRAADVLASRPARPGANDHAPCDESGCHREQFANVSSPLCKICHDRVDPAGENTTPAPYPPTFGPFALAAEFDHALHLDFAKMEENVGFHVSCSDCHLDKDGKVVPPTHAACARCHAPEAAPDKAPPLTRCEGCHIERKKPPSRSRELITGDLVFGHEAHRIDRKGAQIRCVECHADSRGHSGTGNHPVPETASCVRCHDNSNRVPPGRRMRVCETCHSTRQARLGLLAPRSHLPASERPLDHTLAFRSDHGPDAERNPTRCARCHLVLSGSSRDICGECHDTMRPRDHVVTWREFDHGQEAATEAERCATCHGADFCSTCHAQTPRSHFPLLEFADGGHAGPARINPRACITCHPQATMCGRPGCHTVAP